MAGRKLRLTGFTRFLVFMLFAAPAAYMGAHYYNGEDGIQKFKELIGIEKASDSNKEEAREVVIEKTESSVNQTEAQTETTEAPSETVVNSTIARLEDDIKEKDARIEKLYQENESLKQQLETQAKEFEDTKEQLAKIKAAIGQ